MNPNAATPKKHPIFECEICAFICCKNSDLMRHTMTRKHKILTNPNAILTKKAPNTNEHNCICGKSYKHLSSLCAHKNKCMYKELETTTIVSDTEHIELHMPFNIDKDEIIKYLMKENVEFKEMMVEQNKMMMELCKNGTNNTVNSHNKTFNLQIFLNETCKDAMNIMDFVDSLKLQLCDLERIGEVGFVTGISDIIIKNLKALDVSKRPVHCADTKREVMYVKDNNKWEKEQNDNNKLKKAIKHIAKKNSMNINLFKDKYPDCINSHSRKSDQFNKIYIEAYGGSGNEDVDNENKIIKNIAKVVAIDKSM